MDSSPAPAPPLYWCHICSSRTRPSLSGDDLLCSICNDGFLEEIDTDSAAVLHQPLPALASPPPPSPLNSSPLPPPPQPVSQHHVLDLPALFQSMVRLIDNSFDSAPDSVLGSADASRGPERSLGNDHTGRFDTDGYQQSRSQPHVSAFVFPSPSPMVMVLQGGMPAGLLLDGANVATMPHRIGDYFLGSDLDRLIQILSEHDQNNYGTPPAAKTAVESLPKFRITEDQMGPEKHQCAVCKEDFCLDVEVQEMPCKHMYHPDCILPWLAQHNTCPLCRHELPTDDADYEARKRQEAGSSRGTATSEASSDSGRGGEERVGAPRRNATQGSGNVADDQGSRNSDHSVVGGMHLPLQWAYRLPALFRSIGEANIGSPGEGGRNSDGSGVGGMISPIQWTYRFPVLFRNTGEGNIGSPNATNTDGDRSSNGS